MTIAALIPHPAGAGDVVRVTDAWARATVPGQKVAGVYMEISSAAAAQLTGVSTPAADSAEVHEMKMEGGTMKMRALKALDLPAGKPVKLAPGGLHVMLFGLQRPLLAGEDLALTLTVTVAGKGKQEIRVSVPVRKADGGSGGHDHH